MIDCIPGDAVYLVLLLWFTLIIHNMRWHYAFIYQPAHEFVRTILNFFDQLLVQDSPYYYITASIFFFQNN
jgi:hypothetical protein